MHELLIIMKEFLFISNEIDIIYFVAYDLKFVHLTIFMKSYILLYTLTLNLDNEIESIIVSLVSSRHSKHIILFTINWI